MGTVQLIIQLNSARIVVRWLIVFLEADRVETSTSPAQEILHVSMSVFLLDVLVVAYLRTEVNTNSRVISRMLVRSLGRVFLGCVSRCEMYLT